jgi:type II secretion system protein C
VRGDGLKPVLIYAVCAAVMGFTAAFISCALFKPFITAQTAALQEPLALAASKRQPSIFHTRSRPAGNRSADAFSPFGVPESDPDALAASEAETPETAPETGSIEELTLAGTIPNIGAWLEAKDGVKFVSKGESLEGYRLERVERDRAVLSRGGKNFPLFLVYWTPPEKRTRAAAAAAGAYTPPPQAPPPPRRAESAAEYGVKLAGPNGADGTVARETLNNLLMNPLDELKNMRLIPVDNGMKIEGMNSRALFSKLGMQPDDVITNVNGIGINDVGNVANVISSMLSGTRFDFQIERGGQPLKLGYAVE